MQSLLNAWLRLLALHNHFLVLKRGIKIILWLFGRLYFDLTYIHVISYIQVISEQHPKSLLILDDVWSFDVAQAFAVRCRTMVTSRNAAVANGILTPQIYSVSVSEGTCTSVNSIS